MRIIKQFPCYLWPIQRHCIDHFFAPNHLSLLPFYDWNVWAILTILLNEIPKISNFFF